MDKAFDHKKIEQKIYTMWEQSGAFSPTPVPTSTPTLPPTTTPLPTPTPKSAATPTTKATPTPAPTTQPTKKSKQPTYAIILPPPNASGKMHMGNVLMIAIEDLLIRYKRMQGYTTVWIPGTDHAGFETQTTFERELKKQGKSRFDFNSKELYQKIWEFVQTNKHLIDNQIKKMGASVDWSRYVFTLDPKAVDTVVTTFVSMYNDKLVYRSDYLVNYSFKWGTTFSDAEIVHKEQTTSLYYVKYQFVTSEQPHHGKNYLVLATVRPETIFVDTHIAVHPADTRNNSLIGRQVYNPLTQKPMTIIGDTFVDPKFGTGIVKLTPAHDKKDFEIAQKHKLPIVNLINLDGTLNANAGNLQGLSILQARQKAVELLTATDSIAKVNTTYQNLLPVDYRSGDYVENLVLPNWFVHVEPFKKDLYAKVKSQEVKLFPKWRENTYLRWVENMHDWAISRQIVWGIRIPVWYDITTAKDIKLTFLHNGQKVTGMTQDLIATYSVADIEAGLQTLIAPSTVDFVVSKTKPSPNHVQETDTFDTWFSSGQWPLITMGYPQSDDFNRFYPIDVMETGWEIVTRWVSRMMLFGLYATHQAPFKNIYLHGHVRAIDGRKMSKSLGNTVDPDEYADTYGVDALRMGLISGTANGKDFTFPKDKVIAYRNFANKVWNIARFTELMTERFTQESHLQVFDFDDVAIKKLLTPQDKIILKQTKALAKKVSTQLDKFRFSQAADTLYQFMWHELADNYIERVKDRTDKAVALCVLKHVLCDCLKLLHPFMPFVTEEVWQNIKAEGDGLLMCQAWPKT